VDPWHFYRRHYQPTVNELGLTGVIWHALRHTFASRLAMAGVTEGTIASLLRHSGTAMVCAPEPVVPARGSQESFYFRKGRGDDEVRGESEWWTGAGDGADRNARSP
jgi:hypothetical protein